MALSTQELIIVEQIASRVAKGQTSQQIAIAADLDFSYVERVLALPDFEQIFQNLDSKGYSKWKDHQSDLRTKRQVMALARADSLEYYKRVRDLVLNSKDLSDKERIDGLFNLMKIAKVGEGELPQETLILSEDNLKVFAEALAEVNK
jgi:hypothetical protein